MSRKSATDLTAIAAGCAAALAASLAHADITLEQRMSVEGAGMMSMVNMTGTTTTSISGERSRTDNDMQMKSKLVKMFAKGAGQSSQIVRLDEDKIYDLNTAKKQYTETSLAAQKAQLAAVMEKAKQAQEKQPSPIGMDEAECEWSDPKVDVKKTGATATIAGYAAEQTVVEAVQSCKNVKTGSVCDMALSLDQWLAPGFDGGAEAMKFHKAYAQKVGLTAADAREVTARAEAMFGRYNGMWKQVADKMGKSKGYPVRMSFALSFGGPQCQSAQEAQSLPPAPTAGEMGTAMATAAGEAAGQAAASKAGQSALGGYAGQIGGKLAGKFLKKKKQDEQPADAQPAEAAAAAPAANNMITPLRVTSELVSVKTDAIPASVFEVPVGFKKVSNGD